MNKHPKPCIKCKFNGNYYANKNGRCTHPKNKIEDPILESRIIGDTHYLRTNDNYCGEDGKWWEPKPIKGGILDSILSRW